jgi:hypothetical protein
MEHEEHEEHEARAFRFAYEDPKAPGEKFICYMGVPYQTADDKDEAVKHFFGNPWHEDCVITELLLVDMGVTFEEDVVIEEFEV